MSRSHNCQIGDLVLVMIGPPLGLYFSKSDRQMWNHGLVVGRQKKTYIVHVGGIIKKVSKLCIRQHKEK